jgi:holo-[acyl-carrier protein] synthase
MFGIGVDVVAISRIADLEKRYGQRFRDKLLAPGETARNAEALAGLWAAKEAVVKSMGCGFSGFGPASVAIRADQSGAPRVSLLDEAARVAEQMEIDIIHVSISHDAGVAVACAVALRRFREVQR